MPVTKFTALLADAAGNPLIDAAGSHVADATGGLATDYTDDASAKDLDTDARRVAAMNATNTVVNALAAKINAILVVLENHGLVKSS